MAIAKPQPRYGLLVLSLFLALLLTVMPMPDWTLGVRPQWVAMALVFWILRMPDRLGIFFALLLGLVVDVLTSSALGEHGLSYALVAYVTGGLHQRILTGLVWQQALFVGAMLSVERLISLWVLTAGGYPPPDVTYWLSPVVGMLIWPLLSQPLQPARRA